MSHSLSNIKHTQCSNMENSINGLWMLLFLCESLFQGHVSEGTAGLTPSFASWSPGRVGWALCQFRQAVSQLLAELNPAWLDRLQSKPVIPIFNLIFPCQSYYLPRIPRTNIFPFTCKTMDQWLVIILTLSSLKLPWYGFLSVRQIFKRTFLYFLLHPLFFAWGSRVIITSKLWNAANGWE